MNALTESMNSWGARFAGFVMPMLMQSAVLIAVLLALDFALRKKVRATLRYAVWMLALVKLALPPSLASPTGAAYWLPAQTTAIYSTRGAVPAALTGQAIFFLVWLGVVGNGDVGDLAVADGGGHDSAKRRRPGSGAGLVGIVPAAIRCQARDPGAMRRDRQSGDLWNFAADRSDSFDACGKFRRVGDARGFAARIGALQTRRFVGEPCANLFADCVLV